MRANLARLFLVVLLSCGAPAARSYGMGPATIVSDLVWSFSTAVSGLSGCNELRIDAIGDLARSSKFTIYGSLNCPDVAGAFGVDGSGYLGTDGSLNVNLRIGIGAIMLCNRMPGFTGTCQLFTAAAQPLGPAQLTFR